MLCSRRKFFQSGVLVGGMSLLPMPVLHSNSRITAALLGAGEAGRRHLLAARSLGVVDFLGICDPVSSRAEAAAALAQAAGVGTPRVYHDYVELLEKERPRLVVLASPDHLHLAQCLAALKGGAHVLLETLPVRTGSEAEALASAVSQFRHRVTVAAPWRLCEGMKRARRLVETGKLGELQSIQVIACDHDARSASVPDTAGSRVDWQQWLAGTSWPERNRNVLLARGWQNWRSFGNGFFSGDGFRHLDEAWWVAGEPAIRHIFAAGGTPGVRSRHRAPARLVAAVELAQGRLTWQQTLGVTEPGQAEGSSCLIRGSRGALHWGTEMGVTFVSSNGEASWHTPRNSAASLDVALWKELAEALPAGRGASTDAAQLLPSTWLALQIMEAWDSARTICSPCLAA